MKFLVLNDLTDAKHEAKLYFENQTDSLLDERKDRNKYEAALDFAVSVGFGTAAQAVADMFGVAKESVEAALVDYMQGNERAALSPREFLARILSHEPA